MQVIHPSTGLSLTEECDGLQTSCDKSAAESVTKTSILFERIDILTLIVPNKNCSRRHFYAPPQYVAGYYVIPSELLSVCPSVRPSVRG